MITRVAVVIPAADEERDIGACLTALAAARRELHSALAINARVVVVLDDCRDDTAAIVAGFPGVDSVISSARRVGAARRLGASVAMSDDWAGDGWLANTDADCVVPVDWLTRMVAEANAGANVVLGTVRLAPGLPAAAEHAWHAVHQLGDDHPHVHGANLGIDAASYFALGGWANLAAHEDADLVERAMARPGLRIRRSGSIGVETSTRLRGRAPQGFAGYLEALTVGAGEAS